MFQDKEYKGERLLSPGGGVAAPSISPGGSVLRCGVAFKKFGTPAVPCSYGGHSGAAARDKKPVGESGSRVRAFCPLACPPRTCGHS